MVHPAFESSDSAAFDQAVTAPVFGYKDVWDYYERASSTNKLPDIKTPLLVLHALDDPIVGTSLHRLTLIISGSGNTMGWNSSE